MDLLVDHAVENDLLCVVKAELDSTWRRSDAPVAPVRDGHEEPDGEESEAERHDERDDEEEDEKDGTGSLDGVFHAVLSRARLVRLRRDLSPLSAPVCVLSATANTHSRPSQSVVRRWG